MEIKESINLAYQDGSSDKVYNIQLIEDSGTFSVKFQYGRRGSSLSSGEKCSGCPEALARKTFSKLLQEKTSKGYQEISGGVKKIITTSDSRDTGLKPQLLNEISEAELEEYMTSDKWCAQPKYDGRRKMYIKSKSGAVCTNRKGLTVAMSEEMQDALNSFEGDIIVDGEDMGDYTVLFDLLSDKGEYKTRYLNLQKFVFGIGYSCFKIAPTAWTTSQKRKMYNQLKVNNDEGIVFKHIDSLYKPGRPNSGGDQLKFKFISTATCLVTGINPTKRSVSLGVYDLSNPESIIDVGNVTVYPNQEIPAVGSAIEVRYLYYYPGGSLFQPRICGEGNIMREDMTDKDCLLSQLKHKKEEDE